MWWRPAGSFATTGRWWRRSKGTPFKLIIVGGAGVRREFAGDDQVQVLEEIPNDEFMAVVRRAAAVVVPLMDRRISAGQTVVLQAMAMGKLVIATNTAGTEDYIDHMVDGVLVPPGDVEEMRRAIGAAASGSFASARECGPRAVASGPHAAPLFGGDAAGDAAAGAACPP